MDRILSKLGIGAADRRSAREGIAVDKLAAGAAYRNQKQLLVGFGVILSLFLAGVGVFSGLLLSEFAPAYIAVVLYPILVAAPFYAVSDYFVYGDRRAQLSRELAT